MATLSSDGTEIEVNEYESLVEAREQLGIPFGCKNGSCGTCLSNILSGEENLTDLTFEEKSFGLHNKKTRLMCQCQIKSGSDKIDIKSAY